MYIARYRPLVDLAPYIYEYLIVSLPAGMPLEKCIPDGFVKLFIYTGSHRLHYVDQYGKLMDWGDGFSGHPIDEVFYVQANEPIEVLVCSFRPQGIHHLYNTPIQHLNNDLLPAEVLMGNDGARLKEQLQEASSDMDKIAVMNSYFHRLVKRIGNTQMSSVAYAQDKIMASNGIINIEELAAGISTTRRSLERNFLKEVGMTPKYFARVLRFNYAIGHRQVDPACDWQNIIYNCGYFDQSHFIKDFKHFTGDTPEFFYQQDHVIKEVCVGRDWQIA